MKWMCLLSAVFASLMTVTVQAAAPSSTDASFVQTAQADLLGEYALAVLARGKAHDPQLKSTASEIAANAGKATEFLKSYAATHSVTLDNKPTLRADAQYGNLQALSGKAFDQGYAQALNTDAQLQLSDFQDEAQSGNDPALKAFAQREAAMLQQASTVAEKVSQ